MASESGYSNQKKLGTSQFKTINQMGSSQFGTPMALKTLFDITPAAQAIVSVSDILGDNGRVEFWNIEITGHTAIAGNVLRMISGTLVGWEFNIESVVDADNLYVLPTSNTRPIAAETAKIMGWVTNRSDSSGSQIVVVDPAPVAFELDGVSTNVAEDTAVAANNIPLPSKLFIQKDGVNVPVNKDTGTSANNVGIPVEIIAASGTPINITAGDINIQTTDLGPNFDSMRIGDGSGNYIGVTASAEARTRDANIVDFPNVIAADGAVQPTKGVVMMGHNGAGNVSHVRIDGTSRLVVSVTNSVLPTGASVEAKQDTGNTSLGSIDTKLTSQATAAKQDLLLAELQLKADLTETQPVSIASIPLATGAATEAKQDTGNTSLSSIDTKLTSQATAANQTSTNTKLDTIITNTTSLATAANQAADAILIGAVTETAPASDTASSGLNGRLQRIAQRLTSLLALLPASLGQKTMANSLAVTLASDQSALNIATGTAAGTVSSAQVTVGTSAVRATVAGTAPNAARKLLLIKPSKNNSGSIYMGASGVTTSNGLEIIGPDTREFPFDSGDYYLISDTAGQTVEILEKV